MKQFYVLIYFLFLFSSCEKILFEEQPSNDPIGNFESLWKTFDEKYAVFEQRNVNWKNLYDQYRPQINAKSTDEELFEVATSLLAHLDDGHVSLMAEGRPFWSGHKEFREREKDLLFNYYVVQNNYIDGPVTNINNQYRYGKIDGEIGYMHIANLSGDKPKFIDDFIQNTKNTIGIIIDLRHNNGGDFTNGEVIASRFADKKNIAFSATPKNGPGPDDYGKTVDYFIEADGPIQYSKKVVVITNGYTISAGENLALYFRVLPNVTIIGENTAGAMGERIEKEMPNGWIYSITGQIMRAADGISYEGLGIPPNVFIENTLEDLEMGVDNVLELAIETLQ